MFLYLVGVINWWGARLFQPLLILISISIVFSMFYEHVDWSYEIKQPWQKSFDIATLAGYSNQVVSAQPAALRLVEGIQLLASIFLYTVFFSTIVSRISRSR